MIALFLGLLIKSGVIAGAGLALAGLPGFRNPTDRVDILRGAVCLLIALPLIAALGPDLPLPLLPSPAAAAVGPETLWAGDIGPVTGVAVSTSAGAPSALVVAAWIWALGVLVVAGRFGLGVLALRRWTRDARPVTAVAWMAPLTAFPARKRPKLLASTAIGAPMSWGLPPGVVLLDAACLNRPETARAVMAHELAHVRRRDWLFLALSRMAVALFWFNPLVWALHASLAARTEDAADAAALTEVDPPTYAQTLVSLAAGYGHPAAVGLTGPARSLARRIACIMKSERPASSRPLLIAIAVGGLAAVATPLAAIELAPRAPAAIQTPDAPPPPPAPPALPTSEAFSAPPAPPEPPAAPEAPEPPQTFTWSENGNVRVVSYADLTPEERRQVDEARQMASAAREAAAQARIQAEAAREQAAQVRVQAEAARADAAQARVQVEAVRVNAVAMAAEAREQARAAQRMAADARVQAAAARAQAVEARANARVNMAHGADQMERGARQMREEAVRLRDPAYRARQIEKNRDRGEEVTDAELRDLAARLPGQADELEASARRLRAQANNRDL